MFRSTTLHSCFETIDTNMQKRNLFSENFGSPTSGETPKLCMRRCLQLTKMIGRKFQSR